MVLTVVVSAFTAFFSTVVLQYLFGPWLEARKNRMLAHGAAAAEFSDRLRELEGILFELVNYSAVDRAAYVKARGQLRRRLHEMDLLGEYQRLRIRPEKHGTAAGVAVVLGDHILATYLPVDNYLLIARQRVLLAADLIDPSTAPWTRTRISRKLRKLTKSMSPDYHAANARVTARDPADGGLSL